MKYLTAQHCLFPISSEQLSHFQAQASKWEDELPSLNVQVHNQTDAYAAVLNCWAFSQTYNKKSFFSPEKSFSHQTNIFIIDLLSHSHQLSDFLNRYQDDADKQFVLSYYLGFNCMRWVEYVLTQEDPVIAQNIFTMNRARSYYLMNEENVAEQQDHILYIQQKLVTHLLAQDSGQRDRFEGIIEKSYNQTEYTVETYRKATLKKRGSEL